ncbi:nudix hydrolase 8 isoform X2 [Dendrobium catenatum]|uniref:nudix hydrolase 8 isoform X2 n=1 Tax=Dendrobium catenatum TaxID=906689 RepID=UPI0010A03E26|nr:nudix hydrolase 8 isoform X2 [Dendrobium catenatum]
MASLRLQFSLPEINFTGKISSNKNCTSSTFKFSCMEISNGEQKSSSLHSKSLLSSGKKPCRKEISVATPYTSITITNELLDAYEDEYDGVVIDSQSLPGKKGVWLKILEKQADLVPVALKQGFSYHHAEPGYVMLTYWIPEEPCFLPSTATHQIGVGGFVINESKEVLVVKEKKCPLRCSGMWKLPTGLINKSEEIFSGVVREVKEETGIETAFLEVVAFRHAHQVAFDKSDLFFVCMLKPLTFKISIDESEIQDAKWMALEEFSNQPFQQEDKLLKNITGLCVARYQNKYQGFTAQRMMSKFDDRLTYLYHGYCM